MLRYKIISGCLLLITCAAVVFGLNGGIPVVSDEVLKGVIYGMIASIFASAVWSIIILVDDPLSQDKNLRTISAYIATHLANQIGALPGHVRRIDRNLMMGENYWLNVIAELDSTPDPVYFCGSSMTLWLDPPYRNHLQTKLIKRIQNACKSPQKKTKTSSFHTYIAIDDLTAYQVWETFLDNCITTAGFSKSQTSQLVRLVKHSKNRLTYSAVMCGQRMAITAYTSLGRSQSSPTMDIVHRSDLWNLYEGDMRVLLTHLDGSNSSEETKN